MKKISLLLVLLASVSFSNPECAIKSEIGIKKLVSAFNEVGFKNVKYEFLGKITSIPNKYLYKFSAEVDGNKVSYQIMVDVKEGAMHASDVDSFENLEVVEAGMTEIICDKWNE